MDSDEDVYPGEFDERKHQLLLENVLTLDKTQHLKKPTRTEPSLQISEFNLVKSLSVSKGSVHINELTKTLKGRKTHIKIKKNVESSKQKAYTLPRPLEKPQADRIKRAVAYEKTRLELDKWEPIVTSQRVSTNLKFPLSTNTSLDDTDIVNLKTKWRLKTTFDKEFEKIKPNVEEYHVDLEKEKFPLTMKELMERRTEVAKLRAHQSYKEAKARRQNKIKSKKFHRIQRREKIKQQLKEFEVLIKINPEEALKKLEDIEKTRAEERFSLRHRSTGQWAKNKQVRAKYDKESRQALAQQLRLSKELTQKVNVDDDSEEEGDKIQAKSPSTRSEMNSDNPWVNNIRTNKEVTDFVSGYRKYWSDITEEKKSGKENKNSEAEDGEDILTVENIELTGLPDVVEVKTDLENNNNNIKSKKSRKTKKKASLKTKFDWDVTDQFSEKAIDISFNKLEKAIGNKINQKYKSIQKETRPKKKKNKALKSVKATKLTTDFLKLPDKSRKPKIDEELLEQSNIENDTINSTEDLQTLKNILGNKAEPEQNNIDPNKYLNVKVTNLNNDVPDVGTSGDNEESSNQRDLISEAFEDDDIIEDFNKEKHQEIEKDKPKDIDLSLPGWGCWGGTNIKVNKRRNRRFIIKMPEKVPRIDDHKERLIINEKALNKIKEHMVSEVPFPFKSVKDFESSIRNPIGSTFVPETAFRKFIKPAVRTRMGSIIEPMSKDVLLKRAS